MNIRSISPILKRAINQKKYNDNGQIKNFIS